MGRIPSHIVDQIYNAIDIVDVISDYLTLKKRGANYWALSPFNNEKSPSFAVNPVKGIYKDFSSGKGGNAVNFLMEMEGYAYVEALRHLAKKYGIELEEEEETPEEAASRDRRQSLFIVNEFAAQYFHDFLLKEEQGKLIGLSYFKERGLLQSTIEQFQLGYAPDSWDALVKEAAKKKHNEQFLLDLGLASRSQKTGKLIDRFRGRVIFPIANPMGKVLGFGGRILGSKKDIAKYINSPESDIYHKSQVLYGLYQAKMAIRDKDLCILTEGYMDVLLLHQNGVKHSVASSGTALTPEQVRLIKRFTKNVLMIYDGDKAGIKAAMRGIDLLLKDDMNAKVLILPDNHDPDSYVREVGPQAFLDYAEKSALDFVEFKTQVLLEGQNPRDPQTQARLLRELSQTVAQIPDLIQRQMYVKHLTTKLEVSQELILHAIEEAQREQNKFESRGRKRQFSAGQEPGVPVEVAEVKEMKSFEQLELAHQEKELLRILLNHHDREFVEGEGPQLHPDAAHLKPESEDEGEEKEAIPLVDFFIVELEGLQFENNVFEQLKNQIFEYYDLGESLRMDKFLNHEDPAISSLVSELLIPKHENSPNWRKHDAFVLDMDADLEAAVKSAMYHYKYRKVDKLIDENRLKLKEAEANDSEEADKILELYMQLIQLRKAIGGKIGTAGAIKGSDGRL